MKKIDGCWVRELKKVTQRLVYIFIALVSGILLTFMVRANSIISEHTSSVVSSWVTHGVGLMASSFLVIFFATKKRQALNNATKKQSWWLYLGGILGAFTVILASQAINGGIPLSSAISLGLAGQLFFGLASDYFGFFGSKKRALSWSKLAITVLIVLGCFLVIYSL